MMKKFLSAASLTLVLLLFCTVPLLATDMIGLYIDNDEVATESYTYVGKSGDSEGKYYMDVLPQVKNERAYVPISTIATFLGADINWQSPIITIKARDRTVVLTIGDTKAIQNGQSIELDAPPYIDRGRTMVPLRFISEAFGLGVTYKDNRVNIDFPEVKIKDVAVASIQDQYYMTMGSVITENKNDLCISRIYDILNEDKTKEIIEPSIFGSDNDIDSSEFYYELREYTFKDSSNNILAQYKIYEQQTFGNSTGIYMVGDIINSKWYSFSGESYGKINDLKNIGKWKIISNTAV